MLRFVSRQVLAFGRTPLVALATAKFLIFSFDLAAAFYVHYYLALAERGFGGGTDQGILA